MAADIKRIDIKEFRERGYLQELNRRFLHPLGMALEVVVDDDGSERLGGVWDYREDPEGMRYEGFSQGSMADRAVAVQAEWDAKAEARTRILGYVIQPARDGEVADDWWGSACPFCSADHDLTPPCEAALSILQAEDHISLDALKRKYGVDERGEVEKMAALVHFARSLGLESALTERES